MRACALRVRLIAPEQLASDLCGVARENRQQVHTVGRIVRIRCGARCGQQGRQPVHLIATWSLVRPGGNPGGPRRSRRDPQSAFQQFGLLAGERPSVGETLAAVVAGEDDDGVFGQAVGVERLEHAADLRVHRLDHALIGLLRAAVEVAQARACQPFDSASSPGASHGQCGALKCRLSRNGWPAFA